jgi:hypothetical protein
MSEISKPTIENVDITLADTEYSYTLPAGTRTFEFRFRNEETFGKLAIAQGLSGTTYITVGQGETIKEEIKGGGVTLYFRGDNASDVAEILSFK